MFTKTYRKEIKTKQINAKKLRKSAREKRILMKKKTGFNENKEEKTKK